MKRLVLGSIVALALAVAQIAQASTIQLGIRSGDPLNPWAGVMGGPSLCSWGGTDYFTPPAACVGPSSVIITDGSGLAGAMDTNGLTSAITWSGTIGLWDLEVTGTGYDYLGLGRMDLNFSVTTPRGTPTDTLEIYFSQLGNPKALAPSSFQMHLAGTAEFGAVTYGAGMCSLNMANFMISNPFGSRGPVGSGPFDLSWRGGPGPLQNSPYSLTQRLQFTASAAGADYSGIAELQPVPEPASLLLFGTGLVGLRAWGRRRH